MKLTLLLLAFSSVFADEQEFIKANNLFTPDVYKKIAKNEKDNFLVSPFSAETILSLTQSGCKDETGQEIRTALYLPNETSKIENGVKSLLPKFKNDNYTLHSVNKMYIKKNFLINQSFGKVATEVYQSESETIDFSKNEEAAKTMNNWVEKKTENKIKNLIDSNLLNNRTRVVLINALYFKGKWSITFPPMSTRKKIFYKNEKSVIEVDTMFLYDESFLYYECPHLKAQLVEIPFTGSDASLTIILPNEKEGILHLEKNIDWVFLPHNLTLELVDIALPKFRIESKIDFKKILTNLGVTKIFDDTQADLSGIAGQKGDLIVSEIVQKTFVDVDEFGVEAAAATYIPVVVPEMGSIDVPKKFTADHPFIFYLKVKGVILFAGRVLTPNQ